MGFNSGFKGLIYEGLKLETCVASSEHRFLFIFLSSQHPNNRSERLTLMGPCIASMFQYISNKMQRYTFYLYLETALHVSGGTSVVVCTPDDGCRYQPKHVEQFPDINKLLYVFFWVIPRRLNFICRRFGTLCSIFIGKWVNND